jgi:RNA polymerase sigma-70 factor, ECF subfamily
MVFSLQAPIDDTSQRTVSTDPCLDDRAESVTWSGRDGARLRALVDRFHDGLWRAVRRLGVPASHADDAVQRVFLVAASKLPTIRRDGERQYLYGIAVRVASDVRRSLSRRPEISEPSPETSDLSGNGPPQPDELLESKRMLEELDRWLGEMPHPLCEAFVLFEIQELSATEVAAILNLPVGTVASRVRRAREFLRIRYNQSHRAEAALVGRHP